MPNLWKAFSRPEVEEYAFPDAAELMPELTEELTAPEEDEAAAQAEEDELPLPNPDNPVSYAQVQSQRILRDAEREAEKILAQARADAQQQAEEIFEQAKSDGWQAGYTDGAAQGVAQAREEAAQANEAQAQALLEEVTAFLKKAADRVDAQLDENVGELRDLAIAVAEKVVCISLKSSTDVIGRMIQTAIDKRKRREWAHIYIAERDAKRLASLPPSLSTALAALSDRVRIIPMQDDESGTCIIELPDEIIDASASTQLNNIRQLLDTAPPAARPKI